MQAQNFKQDLLDAIDKLHPYASANDVIRLKRVSTALSRATIPPGDYFRVAVFIFLLFAEMQTSVTYSAELRKLFLECDQRLVAGQQHTPPL